jgi:hypothetical protein
MGLIERVTHGQKSRPEEPQGASSRGINFRRLIATIARKSGGWARNFCQPPSKWLYSSHTNRTSAILQLSHSAPSRNRQSCRCCTFSAAEFRVLMPTASDSALLSFRSGHKHLLLVSSRQQPGISAPSFEGR